MFGRELSQVKRSTTLAIVAISAGIVALGLSTVKSYVQNRWVAKRENVACIPSNVDYTFPIVYRQSFLHPVQIDAKVKTFAEQYVHLTQDETIVNYHAVSNNLRYDKVKLSKSKWQAIEMSKGLEKMDLMKSYGDSYNLYKLIADSGVGWKFLIDDITLDGVPATGHYSVTVRGQYQVTYDKAKVDLPHKLWGYKEIRYLVVQGAPTKDGDGNYLNKTGLFVVWSDVQDIGAESRMKLEKNSTDIYLDKEDN